MILQILEIILIPLLGALTAYLVPYLKVKSIEMEEKIANSQYEKYLKLLQSAVEDAVQATNQTFTNVLKEKGEFTLENQQEAFNKTINAIYSALSDEALECLSYMIKDLPIFIAQKIEAQVGKEKNKKADF